MIHSNSYSLKLKIFIICYSLFVLTVKAQDGTRNANKNASDPSGKILLIPFEPKLYMSEIDQKINQETKWNFNQIRENFRHQLDNQLKIKLKVIAPVVSFYVDSVAMAKDLAYIYKSSTLSYDLIEKQGGPDSGIKKGTDKGQLRVEMSTEKRFMNKKITDKDLLPYLSKKYKTDYFIFINELDIKSDADSYDLATDSYQREVTVHYSILDKTSKNITSGIATSTFNSKENNPKKIISISFTPIASIITTEFSEYITQNKKTSALK